MLVFVARKINAGPKEIFVADEEILLQSLQKFYNSLFMFNLNLATNSILFKFGKKNKLIVDQNSLTRNAK